MEPLNVLKPEVARLFAAKEARRRELAALPFPEKVHMVVRLQQMTAPLLRGRGKHVRVWPEDESIGRSGTRRR